MAHKINELKQAVLDAKADERRLLSQQDDARDQRGALLRRQAAGETLTETDTAALKAADEKLAKITGQLKAQRELIGDAEARHARAESEAAEENRQIAAGRKAEVVEDQAEKWAADPKRGFKDHREFCGAVLRAGRQGAVDQRLKPLAAAGSDEHGSYSDPSAAFLLPVAFSPDILSVQAEGDPTASLTRKLPMEAPMVKVNARTDKNHTTSVSGGLVVYRHADAAAVTASRMQTEQLAFDAHELIGLAHATESQISDSPVSFVAMISDGFRDEFAARLLREKIRGTGAGGQYLGILASDALITVSKETGQKADTIVVENIDKMAARCWRYNSERTVYLANATTRPDLRGLKRVVGTGGAPVAYFTTDPQGRERLDGRLIFFVEYCSALGDLGDLILAHLPEYIEGLYQGQQQAESIHVRFENHERSFKFWVRNCGQPWWRSALTPAYGDTQSPFVTLEAR